MESRLFRQKNIDKISSPEMMNDYVKVTNPSVWIVLIGIIVLLVGAAVWGINGSLSDGVTAITVSDGNSITCYLPEDEAQKVASGMKVIINDVTYSIDSVDKRPQKSTDIDEYVLYKGDLEGYKWIYPIHVKGSIEEGIYNANIITEEIPIISFFVN